MRKYFTVVLLAAFAMPATAQVVYKCVGKGGKVEYTSFPCGKHQKTVKAVTAVPEPVRRYPQPAQPPVASQPYAGQSNNFYAPAAPTQREIAQQKCQSAKEWRQIELDRLGLRRTFDILRQLDDYVAQQCKGA